MRDKKCILLISLVSFFPAISSTIHTLNATNFVTVNQTLVSAGDVFELGFFNTWNTSNWYVGIWYSPSKISVRTYVWVANRDNPLNNSAGVLKIVNRNIVILDQDQNLVWSSDITKGNNNNFAELLDSGNFVLRETGGLDTNLWQSFDFPANTLIPGMKLTSQRYLTSWRSEQDPSSGNVLLKLNDHGFPEFFLISNDNNYEDKAYRSGPWNGQSFGGDSAFKSTFELTINDQDGVVSLSFPDNYTDPFTRLVVDEDVPLKGYIWNSDTGGWNLDFGKPNDGSEKFDYCGPNGIVYLNDGSPNCDCPTGFRPKNTSDWDTYYGTEGCVRNTESECNGNEFLNLTNMKIPESSTAFVDRNMSLNDCRDRCLGNCSCTAYASADIRNGGTGCVIWFGDLVDMKDYTYIIGGQDLLVRLANSDLKAADRKTTKKLRNILTITGVVGNLIIFACTFLLWKLIAKYRERKRRSTEMQRKTNFEFPREALGDNMQELPLFSFEELLTATNNFDDLTNQLGRGGFGPVYKGTLPNDQEIAVKRLSRASRQGVEEFMNEVLVISKLQHINLVRLLGCCVEGEERILVYEYMQNKSLNALLFDSSENECLDWRTRYNIIEGISRGLLYLHRDSRLRIIHRDLKTDNILLDEKMIPKISDFGMARIFQRDQDQVNTQRPVGTDGYMPPEYAMEGRFSEKSDVFSFGVLLLEIISGRRNSSFYNDEHCLSLVGYAWKLWNEGNILDMVDKAVSDPRYHREALRCIHVGLLCVQEFAEDRPIISQVIFMLNNDSADVPPPKQPAFSQKQIAPNARYPPQDDNNRCNSINDVTITDLQAR